MITLKEGQKVFDINGNEYLIEKNDILLSLKESYGYFVLEDTVHGTRVWKGPFETKVLANRAAARLQYDAPDLDFYVDQGDYVADMSKFLKIRRKR